MDSFEPLTVSDLEDVFYLYSTYLNYGAGVHPHLQAVLEDPNTIAFKSMDEEKSITGIAIYTKGIALSAGHPELCRKIAEQVGDGVIYTGDALLVLEKARNRHLAHRLNEQVIAELKARLARQQLTGYVLHELWVHPDGKIPAKPVVEHIYGVTVDFGIIKNFYIDFDRFGYLCPICKTKCVCSAQIVLSKI